MWRLRLSACSRQLRRESCKLLGEARRGLRPNLWPPPVPLGLSPIGALIKTQFLQRPKIYCLLLSHSETKSGFVNRDATLIEVKNAANQPLFSPVHYTFPYCVTLYNCTSTTIFILLKHFPQRHILLPPNFHDGTIFRAVLPLCTFSIPAYKASHFKIALI